MTRFGFWTISLISTVSSLEPAKVRELIRPSKKGWTAGFSLPVASNTRPWQAASSSTLSTGSLCRLLYSVLLILLEKLLLFESPPSRGSGLPLILPEEVDALRTWPRPDDNQRDGTFDSHRSIYDLLPLHHHHHGCSFRNISGWMLLEAHGVLAQEPVLLNAIRSQWTALWCHWTGFHRPNAVYNKRSFCHDLSNRIWTNKHDRSSGPFKTFSTWRSLEVVHEEVNEHCY